VRSLRRHVVSLVAAVSTLVSLVLGVVVNIATGGVLPAPLDRLSWLAWPAFAVVGALGVGLAIAQQRLAGAAPTEPVPPVHRAPAELPAGLDTLAARAEDLCAAAALLAGGCRVLALVGPPGVGKSALALRIAHDHRVNYPDGQLFAALRGADANRAAPESVLTRFLDVLGVGDGDRRGGVADLAARFRTALAGRKILVLLDDAHDAAQVRHLLPGDETSLVILTGRNVIPDLPNVVVHQVRGLSPGDSLTLLATLAGAARVSADPYSSGRIVAYCAGLPLAIRIVAARLRTRPARTLADQCHRLADERRRLDELSVGDLAVRSSFAASYDELSATDKLVFRRMGAYPGDQFGAAAAAALIGQGEAVVAAALERLVDVHLIECVTSDRYRLHDLLRLFAAERLADDESAASRRACLRRLLACYASNARRGVWLAQERDNVVVAARHATRCGLHRSVTALVAATHPLFDRSGDHIDRLALWSAAAVAATALGDHAGRARALRWIARSHYEAGDFIAAVAPAREAAAVADRLGERRTRCEALLCHGDALRSLNRFDEAIDALTLALDLATDLHDPDLETNVRAALGTTYNRRWKPELALRVLQPALAHLPTVGDQQRIWLFHSLNLAYRLLGRRREALTYNARMLHLCRRTGDDQGLGHAFQDRAWIAYDEGRYDDAAVHMRQTLAVFERIGNASETAFALEALGQIAIAAGRPQDAIEPLTAAVAQFDRLATPLRVGRCLLYRAVALGQLGRIEAAQTDRAAAQPMIGALPEHETAPVQAQLRQLLPRARL
jgi:tetratricopeptide (TPR) repeat protein